MAPPITTTPHRTAPDFWFDQEGTLNLVVRPLEKSSTLEEVVTGAVYGDLAERRSPASSAGQIGVGLIPGLGQIADIRDTAAALKNIWNSKAGALQDLGLALLGWLPGVGDSIKVAAKAVIPQKVSLWGTLVAGLRSFVRVRDIDKLSQRQLANLNRFEAKIPKNSEKVTVRELSGGNVLLRADSPAQNIPGSFARYEKIIDKDGMTVAYKKTTYAPDGSIVHIKNK